MRWRFVDKIDGFSPWKEINGRKAASFEECKLLNRLGWDGELPGSIALEACVDQARRLVEKSSGFGQTALLDAVDTFEFFGTAAIGDILQIVTRIEDRGAKHVEAQCRIRIGSEVIAKGRIRLSLVPLEKHLDAQVRESMWKEAHVTA